jgi:YD repeat-containing protein
LIAREEIDRRQTSTQRFRYDGNRLVHRETYYRSVVRERDRRTPEMAIEGTSIVDMHYDERGRRTSADIEVTRMSSAPSVEHERYAYDERDRLISMEHETSEITESYRFTYEGDRLFEVRHVDPTGVTYSRSELSYDAAGRAIAVALRVCPEDRCSQPVVDNYLRDAEERVVAMGRAAARDIVFRYDAQGRLAAIEERARLRRYVYDERGRVSLEVTTLLGDHTELPHRVYEYSEACTLEIVRALHPRAREPIEQTVSTGVSLDLLGFPQ